MSKHELIQAYVGGAIDRRGFVRGLTALGVSSAAALAYAHQLAPSAVAAGGTARGGFVMRAKQADGDYGTDIGDAELAEYLSFQIANLEETIALIDDLIEQFTEDELGEIAGVSVLSLLEIVRDQMQQQLDALLALEEQLGAAPGGVASRKMVPLAQTNPQDSYAELAERLDIQAGVYTGLVPGVQDPEARETLMSIAMVTARHAAFVRLLNGQPPSDSAFEEALTPEEANEEIAAIGTS